MKPLTCFGGWCSSDFSDSNLQYLIMTWFGYITSFVKMFAAEEQLAPRWFSPLDGVSTRRVSSPSQLPHQLQSVLFLCRRGVWVHIPLSAVTRCTPLPQHPAGCLATLSVHGNAANKRPLSSSACTPQLGLNWGNQERRGAGRINGGGGGNLTVQIGGGGTDLADADDLCEETRWFRSEGWRTGQNGSSALTSCGADVFRELLEHEDITLTDAHIFRIQFVKRRSREPNPQIIWLDWKPEFMWRFQSLQCAVEGNCPAAPDVLQLSPVDQKQNSRLKKEFNKNLLKCTV